MSSEILQCRWLVLAQFRGEGSRKPRTSHLVENTGKKFFFLSFNDWTFWRHCSGFGVHRVASAAADYTPRSSRTRREFISRLLVSSSHRSGHRPDVHRRGSSSDDFNGDSADSASCQRHLTRWFRHHAHTASEAYPNYIRSRPFMLSWVHLLSNTWLIMSAQ